MQFIQHTLLQMEPATKHPITVYLINFFLVYFKQPNNYEIQNGGKMKKQTYKTIKPLLRPT